MAISQTKSSKTYVDLPRTSMSTETGIHSAIRRTCTHLWNTRARGYDFRLVRTHSFGPWGRGNPSYHMKKFGDTYVIGQRTYQCNPAAHPDHATKYPHGAPHHLVGKENLVPTDYFWHGRGPYFIVKKDKTFMPAFVDKGRENMLWGMGLATYIPQQYRNLLSAQQLRRYGGAFFGGTWSTPEYYVQGGLIFTDEGVDGYGTTLKKPVIQVYDQALYRKGLEALHALRDLLKVFVDRHGILEANEWWGYQTWAPEFMWKVYHMYQDRGIQGMSPQWILQAQKGADPQSMYSHSWMRSRAMQIAQLSTEQIRKCWRQNALDVGICRFVEAGTPLYNEVSPMEPLNIDYDRVITQN